MLSLTVAKKPEPLSIRAGTLWPLANVTAVGKLMVADGGFTLTVFVVNRLSVVNTCGFIEQAKKDSVDTLLAAADLKETGSTKAVVAVGCMAERYGRELAQALPEVPVRLVPDPEEDPR